jgi:hypothetical protein
MAHDRGAIEYLPDLDRRLDVEEGGDNPAEGLERRPSVNLRMFVYCFAELSEGGDVEDFGCVEVLRRLLVVQLEDWHAKHIL